MDLLGAVGSELTLTRTDSANTPKSLGKKILYLDMDNVLVDFVTGIERLEPAVQAEYQGRLDEVPGIFALMDPVPGAVEAFHELSQIFDTYLLSTAPWLNPSAWSDKVEWVHKHLGVENSAAVHKRLILSHHKNLNVGDFLVDDRSKNGAEQFTGEWIQYGKAPFETWDDVVPYLVDRA